MKKKLLVAGIALILSFAVMSAFSTGGGHYIDDPLGTLYIHPVTTLYECLGTAPYGCDY